MRALWRFLVTLARELSDESAYHRFLALRGVTHSREQWRLFSEGRLRAKYSRAKCC